MFRIYHDRLWYLWGDVEMPPFVFAAVGVAGVYAAYRWVKRAALKPLDVPQTPPLQRLVQDPETGIYVVRD